MFFTKDTEPQEQPREATGAKFEAGMKKEVSSNLGRPLTTVENAKAKYYKKPTRRDPKEWINKQEGMNYYGHTFGEEIDEPVYIPTDETTMEAFIGSTGTGKGVFLGNKLLEALQRRQGVIIIDPKQDTFLAQIALEELRRQGRENDLQIVSWPTNCGYTGIEKTNTSVQIVNKLVDALGIGETGNPGVDYYTKNARVMLKKVLPIFFGGGLGIKIEKDLAEIVKHIRHLKEDLEKEELLAKEIGKPKPNFNLISKYEKRFFDQKYVERIYWDDTAIETLDSLSKSLAEIVEAGNIFEKYTLDGALYEGKVFYFKCDMLDIASLKMTKMLITDAIQKARKKKAHTLILADEISFYATPTLAGGLATVRSFGLQFILAMQSPKQIPEELRDPIMDNCNVKLFYKVGSKDVFEWIETIGGDEAITKYRTGEMGYAIAQDTEPLLNATKIRALPRAGVGILVAEYLNTPLVVQTSFVAVEHPFGWDTHEDEEFFEKLEQSYVFEEIEENEEITEPKTAETSTIRTEDPEDNGDEDDL